MIEDNIIRRVDQEREIRTSILDFEREKRRKSVRPRQRRRRRDAKITTAQLRAIYKLHISGGISLMRIAEEIWERYGYASPRSCYVAIFKGLYRDMRYPRAQPEALRRSVFKHGVFARGADPALARAYWRKWRREHGRGLQPMCAGRKTRGGAPCRNKALVGSDFCGAHDPVRSAKWGFEGKRPRGRVS